MPYRQNYLDLGVPWRETHNGPDLLIASRKEAPLNSSLGRKLLTVLLCLSLLLLPKQAHADTLKTDAIEILVAAVAIGAALGVGIYFLVRQSPSISGCAASRADGLTLRNEGDQQTYSLIGDTAGIKAGDRIKVSGKKKKKDPSGKHDFLVEKLKKDYGACKVSPATP
jgi:hypothetical protein